MKELYRFRQFLTEEDFKNPILDKYLELKKSIDYKTVFPTDLQSFVDSLDNTEREGLERDLTEGKEDISKIKEVKQLLYRIEELSKSIDIETPKNRGGLGIKDASLIEFLLKLISQIK